MLSFFLLTEMTFTFGSDYHIGTVLDQNNEPIEGCKVFLLPSYYITTTGDFDDATIYPFSSTDKNGLFFYPKLNENKESDSLLFVFIMDEFIPAIRYVNSKSPIVYQLFNKIQERPALERKQKTVKRFQLVIASKDGESISPCSFRFLKLYLLFPDSGLIRVGHNYYPDLINFDSIQSSFSFDIPYDAFCGNHNNNFFYSLLLFDGLFFWINKHEFDAIRPDFIDSVNLSNALFSIKHQCHDRTYFNNATNLGNFRNQKIEEKNDFKLNDTNSGPDKFINFDNIIFVHEVTFSGNCLKPVSFKNSMFLKKVNFTDVIFDDSVIFDGTMFMSHVEFINVKIRKCISFNNASFSHSLKFDNVEINSMLFEKAILPQVIDFDKVNISSNVKLNNSINNPCFHSTVIKMCLLSKADRLNVIFSDALDFEIIPKKDDGNRQSSKEKKRGTYEKLLVRAKEEGYMRSYEIIDKRYREFQYLNKDSWKIWFGLQNWIDKTWWDYGYNKQLIFRNTLVLFFVFVFFNIFLIKKMVRDVYVDKKILKLLKYEDPIPVFNFLKKIPLSVYYTSIIFFVVSISLKRVKYKENLQGFNCRWLFYFGIMYLTGLVCLGYLVNFVITN
jgi:hypothetical protein